MHTLPFAVACMVNKSSPKSLGKSALLPLMTEWNCLLHVLLGMQYPLQTNPVTQPRICCICMAVPHASSMLHCAARFPHQKKKFAPSLTGDINPQSSHWKNGKIKIAYNSAYFQIETFNCTFAQQAVIVHFDRAKRAHTQHQCYHLQAEDDVMVSPVQK